MIHLISEIPNLWEQPKTINRNDFLVTPGSNDRNTYFIMEGAVRVFLNEGGEEHTIRFGYKGSLITPLHSFFDAAPNPFYFQAIRKSMVKIMPKKRLTAYIKEHKDGAALYQKLLEELILQQMEREVDILITSPIERLQRVMKRSPQLFQEIPLKYIASYLRMTPETLSRIQKP